MNAIVITTNPPDLAARLQDKGKFLRRIATVLDKQNDLTVGHISVKRMRGKGPFPVEEGRLGVRTGRLWKSLRRTKAFVAGDAVISSIGSNVVYAGAHELGAQTAPHVITAKNGKALRFGAGGKVLFRKSVKHPGSKIPARRPIQRGIQDRMPAYQEAISKATNEHLSGRDT